nr:hypothetical protein [Modestobacter sp. VKM Ac-2984]
MESTDSIGNQVLRQASVQTNFRDLFRLERDGFLLGSRELGDIIPAVATRQAILDHRDSLIDEGWLTPASSTHLVRGRLLEAVVELQADPLFRLSALVSAFSDLLDGELDAFPQVSPTAFSDALTVNRILQKLLSGLVPLKGRVVDYEALTINGEPFIIHRSISAQLPDASAEGGLSPLYIVGVADESLFWKDIRRIAFTGAEYRLLCRVAQSGFVQSWTPVKLIDVLREAAPELAEQLQNFSVVALAALGQSRHAGGTQAGVGTDESAALRAYASLLAKARDREISVAEAEEIDRISGTSVGWIGSLESRRRVFRQVDSLMAEGQPAATPEEAVEMRRTALGVAGFDSRGQTILVRTDGMPSATPTGLPAHEILLDTEIVAIYW